MSRFWQFFFFLSLTLVTGILGLYALWPDTIVSVPPSPTALPLPTVTPSPTLDVYMGEVFGALIVLAKEEGYDTEAWVDGAVEPAELALMLFRSRYLATLTAVVPAATATLQPTGKVAKVRDGEGWERLVLRVCEEELGYSLKHWQLPELVEASKEHHSLTGQRSGLRVGAEVGVVCWLEDFGAG